MHNSDGATTNGVIFEGAEAMRNYATAEEYMENPHFASKKAVSRWFDSSIFKSYSNHHAADNAANSANFFWPRFATSSREMKCLGKSSNSSAFKLYFG